MAEVAASATAATRKYLAQYAEPEARLFELPRREKDAPSGGDWDDVLVLPACGEPIELFSGFDEWSGRTRERSLGVLVVNAPAEAPRHHHAANERLLEFLRGELSGHRALSTTPPVEFGWFDGMAWLVIDRASSGCRLPADQGVGLARKIGCDIALRLISDGSVDSDWIHTSDADVLFPSDYFVHAAEVGDSALLRPFWHLCDLDTVPGRALALYEISLRYWLLGLLEAGSPYAFHTVGSTVVVRATSYAQVRGFPRRNAAEDFYLLQKLAKVGRVRQLAGSPLRIRQRFSDRVPFGTGRATGNWSERLASGEEFHLYDPRVFQALARWLEVLRDFAEHRDLAAVARVLTAPSDDLEAALGGVLSREEIGARLEKAARQHTSSVRLRRSIDEWFDALRTLKLIHGLRDARWPDLPWRQALRSARFVPDGLHELEDLDEIRRELQSRELRGGF